MDQEEFKRRLKSLENALDRAQADNSRLEKELYGENVDVHGKVMQIFEEHFPANANVLSFFNNENEPGDAFNRIVSATKGDHSDPGGIAFHLTDIRNDAAFIVALHLFPARFTQNEVACGIGQFMIHVSYHVQKLCELMDNADEHDE